MACMSQSIACYKLLRCIVSAAQFACGELCFYDNYAELVAQDATGESTTPLRIDYDALLHFRVVRQQQLMRIELPRLIVWRWAEANSFASELDGGEGNTQGDANRPCTLIEQLREDDMTHFLQSVAPMVAASRRTRSASRMSTTEPLPLSYYPPSPEATSAMAAEKTGGEEETRGWGGGSSACGGDSAGEMDAAAGTTSTAPRRESSCADEDREKAGGVGDASAAASSFVSTAVERREEEGEEEEDRLSRCLETLGTLANASDVHLERGSSTQNNAFLACAPARRKGSGVVHNTGSDAAMSVKPPPSLSSSSFELPFRQPEGATSGQQRQQPQQQQEQRRRRRPPHVSDDEKRQEVLSKRVRREATPPFLSPAAVTVHEVDAAGEKTPPRSPAALADVTPPSSAKRASPSKHRAVLERQNQTTTTATATTTASAAASRNTTRGAAIGGAAYNFSDFMTAPEDAANLPIASEVKKLLGDLQDMLPPLKNKGRRGAGATRARCQLPKKVATTTAVTARKPRKPPARSRGKGQGLIATDHTTTKAAITPAPPPPPLAAATTTTLSQPIAVDASKQPSSSPVEAAAVGVVGTEPGGSSVNMQLFDQSRDVVPTMAASSSHKDLLAPEPPIDVHTLDAPRVFSAPSPGVTPRSDYNLAQEVLHHDVYHRDDEKDVEAVLRCKCCTHTAAAAGGGETATRCRDNNLLEKNVDNLRVHALVSSAPDAPLPDCCHPHDRMHHGALPAPAEGNCRKHRWRRVMRHLNSFSLHLAQARACGEELRGLFLMMLEDAEI